MRRTLERILVAVAIASATVSLSTQASPSLVPGARIRWTTTAEPTRSVVGREVLFRSDTLFVEEVQGSSSCVLPLASLASLEVSEGSRSRTPGYALMGAAVGGLAAVALGRIAWWATKQVVADGTGLQLGQLESKDETNYVQVVLIGAGVGAACGAAIGAMRRGPETWESVNQAGTPLGIIFRIGGDSALGLSVRF